MCLSQQKAFNFLHTAQMNMLQMSEMSLGYCMPSTPRHLCGEVTTIAMHLQKEVNRHVFIATSQYRRTWHRMAQHGLVGIAWESV